MAEQEFDQSKQINSTAFDSYLDLNKETINRQVHSQMLMVNSIKERIDTFNTGRDLRRQPVPKAPNFNFKLETPKKKKPVKF